MRDSSPMASLEVRWFFDGGVVGQPALRRWFETAAWFGSVRGMPAWRGRADDQPDRYLVLPGAADMGVKWREGEFQVKGRVSARGEQPFAGGHRGVVEHWVKWSYPGLPAAWRELFDGGDGRVIAVGKTRALRKLALDSASGATREVSAETRLHRGLAVELTEVVVGGDHWCSLGVEAFPDDAAMSGHFIATLDVVLDSLQSPRLRADESLSYPAWLQRITGRGGG